MSINLDDLFGPDAADAAVEIVAAVTNPDDHASDPVDLRSTPPMSSWPIVPGHVHFDFFHTPEDIEADRWGTEFIPGYHVDPRQPSRLTGLCSPPDKET